MKCTSQVHTFLFSVAHSCLSRFVFVQSVVSCSRVIFGRPLFLVSDISPFNYIFFSRQLCLLTWPRYPKLLLGSSFLETPPHFPRKQSFVFLRRRIKVSTVAAVLLVYVHSISSVIRTDLPVIDTKADDGTSSYCHGWRSHYAN